METEMDEIFDDDWTNKLNAIWNVYVFDSDGKDFAHDVAVNAVFMLVQQEWVPKHELYGYWIPSVKGGSFRTVEDSFLRALLAIYTVLVLSKESNGDAVLEEVNT